MAGYETLFAAVGIVLRVSGMPSAAAAQTPVITIANILDNHRRIYLQRSSSNILSGDMLPDKRSISICL